MKVVKRHMIHTKPRKRPFNLGADVLGAVIHGRGRVALNADFGRENHIPRGLFQPSAQHLFRAAHAIDIGRIQKGDPHLIGLIKAGVACGLIGFAKDTRKAHTAQPNRPDPWAIGPQFALFHCCLPPCSLFDLPIGPRAGPPVKAGQNLALFKALEFAQSIPWDQPREGYVPCPFLRH